MANLSLRYQVADLCGEDVLAPSQAARGPDLVRAPPEPKRLPVAQAIAQCPRGMVVAAQRAGQEVAVCVLQDGSAVVVPDRCPHDGGLLSDGYLDGDKLVCARHGWEFDARSGQCQHRSDLCIASAGA